MVLWFHCLLDTLLQLHKMSSMLNIFYFYGGILMTSHVACQERLPSSSYNFANMGLSMTCDFEWSMCGWTQETSALDQLDWRRHRGASSTTSYYKIAGDHTSGKDAFGFYMYLDGADYRRPFVDADATDPGEQLEPDELLAQQMGIASSMKTARSLSGPLHKPPFFRPLKKFTVQRLRLSRMAPNAPPSHRYQFANYRNNYPQLPPIQQTGATYSRYPSQPLIPNQNVDTNSDVKPYDLLPPSGLSRPNLNSHLSQPLAILIGPRVETPVNLSFTFWYHMRGNNVGRLTLYRGVLARPDQIIWEKTGHQSFEWTQGQVTLERGTFQIRFEGTINPRGNPGEGYIGLDDLVLEREAELPMLINAQSRALAPPSFLPYHTYVSSQFASNPAMLDPSSSFHSMQHFPATNHPTTPKYDSPLISPLRFHQNLLETLARQPSLFWPTTIDLTTTTSRTAPITTSSTTTRRSSVKPVNSLLDHAGLPYPSYLRNQQTTIDEESSSSFSHTETSIATEASTVTFSPELNAISKLTWTKLPRRIVELEADAPKKPQLLLPVFLPPTTTEDGGLLGVIDQTEISAVIQEEPLDRSKIYLTILSCLGVVALVVIIVIFIKRAKRGVFDLMPSSWRTRRPLNIPQNSNVTRRLSSPPSSRPQPPLRRP